LVASSRHRNDRSGRTRALSTEPRIAMWRHLSAGRIVFRGGYAAWRSGRDGGAMAEQSQQNEGGRIPLAAIGASAGGVRALQAFFEALPARGGAAFVVIVHLDPEHQSELPRIIAARTGMPGIEAG